jgi:hypothetical protein
MNTVHCSDSEMASPCAALAVMIRLVFTEWTHTVWWTHEVAIQTPMIHVETAENRPVLRELNQGGATSLQVGHFGSKSLNCRK